MYINNVVISGNLVDDPELKILQGEKPVIVANFRIANNEPKKDGNTTFVKVTAFGRTAEVVGEYLAKGMPIIVVGALKQRSFENKEGQKVTYNYIQADNVQMFPKNGNTNDNIRETVAQDYTDEDIPF